MKKGPYKGLTVKYLKRRLSYNKLTGDFIWKPRPIRDFKTFSLYKTWTKRYSGKIAGCKSTQSRRTLIRIDNNLYLSYVLAWFYVTGDWPMKEIDHINNDCSDNRWKNLRLATHTQNMRNRSKQSNNKSGYKGVCFHKASGKWKAAIQNKGKSIYLGIFDDAKLAYKAYCNAAKDYHKSFRRV